MNRMIGIILISAGILLLVIGIVIYFSANNNSTGDNIKILHNAVEIAVSDGVLTKNEKDNLRRLAIENNVDEQFILDSAQRRLSETSFKAETAVIDQNKKNGDDFEKFIADKLNPKYYVIKHWAGDKYINGKYAETTLNPDFVIEVTVGKKQSTFAIECKWRKELFNGGLKIAEDQQLERYRKYEHESGNPVFLAIGLGNEGFSPTRLFLVPLSKIDNSFLHINYLSKFEKNEIGRNLFYDIEERELR